VLSSPKLLRLQLRTFADELRAEPGLGPLIPLSGIAVDRLRARAEIMMADLTDAERLAVAPELVLELRAQLPPGEPVVSRIPKGVPLSGAGMLVEVECLIAIAEEGDDACSPG
jgi:hypothetical protein